MESDPLEALRLSEMTFTSGLAAARIRAMEGIAENASAEVLAEVARRAAHWGVLSVLLIFLIGGGLYFFVLPRVMDKKK